MKGSNRNLSLEWCKLLSICAVVYQHSVGASSTLLTHFAVPAFTIISVYFAMIAGAKSQDPLNWLILRSTKLYILFLKWNIFYAIIRWMSFAAAGTWEQNAYKITPLELLLTGCANAMYYLPFIIAANAFGFSIAYLGKEFNKLVSLFIGLCFLALSAWLSFSPSIAAPNIEFIPFETHMIRKSLPAVALICGWHFFQQATIVFSVSRYWLLAISGFFLATGTWHLIEVHRVTFYGETAAGLGVVLFFLALSSLSWPEISPNLSLWLFISHSFLLHGIRFVSKMIGNDYDKASAFVQIVAAFGIMGTLIFLYFAFLDKSPNRRKWILAG